MEKENYTAYDLEKEEPGQGGVRVTGKPAAAEARKGGVSDGGAAESGSAVPEAELKAKGEIEAMMADMGAEKLLEIIRENRNAAITQILDEMERTPGEPMQSGRSVGGFCNSIFDLAGMA